MIPYSFHPEADAELAGAALFYESRVVGLTWALRPVSLIGECWFIGFLTGSSTGATRTLSSSSRSLINAGIPAIGDAERDTLTGRFTGRTAIVATRRLRPAGELGRSLARTLMPSMTRTITEGVAMRMHNPPHPGEIIKTLCLEPLGVTVTQAAEALGVSRKTLSAILNGRAGVSPEMAVRFSIAFGTSSESWLNQQTQYDLWHAEQRRKRLRVVKLAPV